MEGGWLTGAVIVEEGIETGAVDEYVAGGAYAEAECHAAGCGGAGGAIDVEVGIVEGGIYGEGEVGCGVRLIVWNSLV